MNDKQLAGIIQARDRELKQRAKDIKEEMDEIVTEPWATVHPQRLDRALKRDKTLVAQVQRQVVHDSRVLKEAQSVSHRESQLIKVAKSRSNLSFSSRGSSPRPAFDQSGRGASTAPLPQEKHGGGGGARGDSRGEGLASRFREVRDKAAAKARLHSKHRQLFRTEQDARAADTMESMPRLLPPFGLGVLAVLALGFFGARRAHRRRPVSTGEAWGSGGGGRGRKAPADADDEWQELGSKV